MADKTSIEWTQGEDGSPGATWNPITGCTLVSEGCRHCYAARLAATRLRQHPSRAGLARLNAAGEAKFTGEVRLNAGWLDQPLRWRRPRRIFVCAHGDLFHEAVPDEWIDRVFAVMALAPQHVFQVLTKRPERARWYLTRIMEGENGSEDIADAAVRVTGSPCAAHVEDSVWPLPNVWLGTSVEDQATADERIPHLLATPAAVRFLSAEPLLGPVDLTQVPNDLGMAEAQPWLNALGGYAWDAAPPDYVDTCSIGTRLDWVIVGGESGPAARPMHPDWARSLRDQCQAAGVPFFFKQWGEWAPLCEIGESDDLYCAAPESDPEARRRCRYASVVMHTDGALFGATARHGFHGPMPLGAFAAGSGAMTMFGIGKKAAGRQLDGREWSEMPGGGNAHLR
ncbi:MAG TPA: phage Gp37/Gp68 family protein [Amaricoccus sp.]|uniref:phage Gp37/Gp68 family protein n=1 Tax=Amaricoccus sp. TaxID=1872485 RepID=UPI002C6FD74A|nr:phage Gp37/Gp68 family protein [Amaricoccus sp.]HMR51236.1 phage Gp37/Gp68 family protein [Amaricoccus sp.]HMT98015.1 phage Gp37/Gp68 family protein [Amaricoccus sp.]